MSGLHDDDPGQIARRMRLGDGIGFLARVLSARANLAFQQLTDQHEITPRQFGVLLSLHQRGALTLTALAEAIQVDRSTLSEMTRRMRARGLISREGNHVDRRSARVAVTPEGIATLMRLVNGAARLQGMLLADLPPDRRAAFLEDLRRLAHPVDASPRRPPGREE